MLPTVDRQKVRQRQEIAEALDRFLRAGGKIRRLDFGETANPGYRAFRLSNK